MTGDFQGTGPTGKVHHSVKSFLRDWYGIIRPIERTFSCRCVMYGPDCTGRSGMTFCPVLPPAYRAGEARLYREERRENHKALLWRPGTVSQWASCFKRLQEFRYKADKARKPWHFRCEVDLPAQVGVALANYIKAHPCVEERPHAQT